MNMLAIALIFVFLVTTATIGGYGLTLWQEWRRKRPAKFKLMPWGLICTRGGMPPKGPQRVDISGIMPPCPRNALLLTEIVIDHGNGNRSIFILDERTLKAMG